MEKEKEIRRVLSNYLFHLFTDKGIEKEPKREKQIHGERDRDKTRESDTWNKKQRQRERERDKESKTEQRLERQGKEDKTRVRGPEKEKERGREREKGQGGEGAGRGRELASCETEDERLPPFLSLPPLPSPPFPPQGRTKRQHLFNILQ